MSKRIGIWIDHRDAVIVTVQGKRVSVEHVESGAESRYRSSGGWKAAGTAVAQSTVKEQKAEHRRDQQLGRFYEDVLERLGDVDAIAVFGPGEAKLELQKAIKDRKSLAENLRAVEPADTMTEKQFVAKVRAFYGVPEKRHLP